MTLEQAIAWIQENSDKLPDPLPVQFFTQTPEETAGALRTSRVKKCFYRVVQEWYELDAEDGQHRDNLEWEELIEGESDAQEAAYLVLDWLDDKTQASIKMDGDIEVMEGGEWLDGEDRL